MLTSLGCECAFGGASEAEGSVKSHSTGQSPLRSGQLLPQNGGSLAAAVKANRGRGKAIRRPLFLSSEMSRLGLRKMGALRRPSMAGDKAVPGYSERSHPITTYVLLRGHTPTPT
ncbi:hypothetical protein SKAU_G00161480 [Synaphobranchus kaupii]|uniref:Uncharacterized protein n=1 Tax=Synaphobranchus kaupii TaxID=118154 RepID=A0A9Q1FIS7_SYNKA|nr:hypothetical protein SKAU_G00161480 [Synaphobranchus kaupii]